MNLPEKIVALHRALDGGGIPHAFGGALALAWCTRQARGTVDIDVNVLMEPAQVRDVLAALPNGVKWSDADVRLIERDGQARLWWEATPVDLFFSTTDFHATVAERCRHEPFLGERLPFLSCRDLAVFKTFFNRTRDWADLEEMAEAGTLDVEAVLGVIVGYLGGAHERIERLRRLRTPGR